MRILPKKNFINSHFFSLIVIVIFSISINFNYSKFGVFPIDTFLHFDSAYRILNNEYPVRDFWIVSGILVDFLQSIFFIIFGVNWFAYIFHSSFFNAMISLLTYYFLVSFNISVIRALIYTLCFSTMAYTVSGTPFVDHHAVLFSLASIYLIILNFKNKNKYFWYFIVLFFYLSFFSKQVPVTYILISVGTFVSYILIKEKKIEEIKIILFSTFVFLFLSLFSLSSLNIELKDFYLQYIQYPKTIGDERLINFDLSFQSFFNKYKFIILPIILIFLIKIKQSKNKNIRLNTTDTKNLLIFFLYSLSLILHQILTKNQIFIYFLIPVFFALAEYELKIVKFKYNNFISIMMLLIVILITIKYHVRYNENRKFHELENVNFKFSLQAQEIDKSLKGLFWINPHFDGTVSEEVELIKKAKTFLDSVDGEIMLITHYLFLDSITKKKLNYPNRTFTYDGASMPGIKNNFKKKYKEFFIQKIKEQNIKGVYFFKHEKIPEKIITDNLNKKCYSLSANNLFNIYNIKCLY